MDFPTSHFWFLISSTTCFFLLLQSQLLAHSLFHSHHQHGKPTTVTKHLYFPNFNPNTNHDVKLLGSAAISQDQGFIQIPDPSPTVDQTYQAGKAIFSSPVRLFDPQTLIPASFQTTFSFQFTTSTTTSGVQVSGCNGLAFVIVPDEFTVGRAGPWLGILNDACNHYKVFAVEFDTNHDPKFGNPDHDHVGINIGSIVSFKTANLSETNVSLRDNSIDRAWIIYDGQRRWIDVHLGSDGDPIPARPVLSAPLDLSPFLNEYMFVGFSASTGDSTQIHNIFSWNFSSTIQAYLNVPSRHVCHKNVAHQVSKHSTKSHTNSPSSFMIFLCVVGLFTLSLIILYCNSNRSESSGAMVLPDLKMKPMLPSKPRRFTSLELYSATRRFRRVEVLSGDTRGVLYRGTLRNGCFVAVKREFLNSSHLDLKRVLKRIASITHGSCCHPNLAMIRGWCCENRETIIVYDYFQNGSIDRWLFGLGVLPWSRRFKLIKNIAEALSFLHSKDLTHGNLKTTSVFLDVNYQAVLGDYGFIHLHGESGRVDPVTGKRLDVFGFGMLVLEIVVGKKKIEAESGEEEMGLLGFAWGMHERGEKDKMVDERMGSRVVLEEAIRVLEIGLCCTLTENYGRPSMEEVVQFLNMQKPIRKLPLSRPSELLQKKKFAAVLV